MLDTRSRIRPDLRHAGPMSTGRRGLTYSQSCQLTMRSGLILHSQSVQEYERPVQLSITRLFAVREAFYDIT